MHVCLYVMHVLYIYIYNFGKGENLAKLTGWISFNEAIVSNARTIRAKVDSQNRIVGYVLAKMEEDTAAIGAERLYECLNDGSGCRR